MSYKLNPIEDVRAELTSEQYAEQKKAFDDSVIIGSEFSMVKYDGHEYEGYKEGVKYKSTDGKNWVPETEELKNAYEAGKMLQYQKENGEWVDFSKNTVCDDFKFQKHLNYRIKPAYVVSDKKSDRVYICNHDYTKIQNYIEAIRLIAEKVGTAETDAIEQLARDVGNYLYDLAEGEGE